MPFINIKLGSNDLSRETIAQLQHAMSVLVTDALRKKIEVTSVFVETAEPSAWQIGNQPASVAAYVEVKVTAGTNTAAEKARFISEAYRLLQSILGTDLSPATYIVVSEIAGECWGYGGITQSERMSRTQDG